MFINFEPLTNQWYCSSVDVSVRRVGGAFGGKAKRPKFAAIACALGAHATNR